MKQMHPSSAREAGRSRETASDVARSYARAAHRLLERLAEPGCHAERRGDQVVLVRKGGKLALPAGVPTGVLAQLLEGGAVACASRAGTSVFRITPEGQARLRREHADSETPHADQHREIVQVADADGGTRRVNLREDPLELFRRTKTGFALIGAAEIEAGERLRHDLDAAQALPQVTANWSRLVVDGAGPGPGALHLSERVVAARARVDAAMRAVGPDFAGVLMDVCGFSKGLEALERDMQLPARAGKVALGYALRALARHYGLSSTARGRDSGPMRHWGAADYRPRLASG